MSRLDTIDTTRVSRTALENAPHAGRKRRATVLTRTKGATNVCNRTKILAGLGPVSAMVEGELESIRGALSKLHAAWAARDLAAVALALSGLAERVARHMRWEERNLLATLEARSDAGQRMQVRDHYLHHDSLERELRRIELLVARREGDAAGTDEELELALAELDMRLDAHAREELSHVCLKLDALDPVVVATIQAALDEGTGTR